MEKNRSSALIAAVLAVLIVAGGVAFFAMNREDDTSTQTSQTTQTTQPEQQQPAQTQTQQQAESRNIVETASANQSFTTLVSAVQAADLVGTLSDETKKFTVFAPTNDAFAKLPAGTLDTLLRPENKATLAGILTYHVVAGEVLSSQLTNGQKVTTVQGAQLTVEIMNGTVSLVDVKGNKAKVTQADLKTNNGVIHVIDTVVLPN